MRKKVSKAAVLNFPEPKEARLYYLDKKTNRHKRLSDNIFRDLQYVTRPNDRKKGISLKARTLLTNLIQMILKNPHKEEFVDHTFLSQITEVYSSKQNARLLDQISDIIESTYHAYIKFQGKSKTYGYVIKLTEDGYERAKNPGAFYSDSDGQKCLVNPTKMSTQVDKNVQIYKEEENPKEEINHSYANGFISEKEKIYKKEKSHEEKHATFAPCSRAEPEQVAFASENQNNPNKSVTNCDELQSSKEIPKMKQDDTDLLADEQTRRMLLSQALWKALGEERAGEIQDGCIFRELEPDKVGIYTGNMLLTDVDKDKIPKAIKSVYGENVKITGLRLASKAQEQEHPSNDNAQVEITPKSRPKKQNWLKFKSLIITNNLTSMVNNPMLKVIETPDKVIIETVPFLIERITAPGHLDELERVILETGLTLELHGTNPHPEYKNFYKDPIVLSPKKVLKDQEFKENYKPLDLSEILNVLKNKKEEQNNE
jgi:hypothetical protein